MLNQLMQMAIKELLVKVQNFQEHITSFEYSGTKITLIFAINDNEDKIKKAFEEHQGSKGAMQRGQEMASGYNALKTL